MSIPGSGSPLLFSADAAAAAGYEIERSLRFNSGDSAYLNRTPSSAGNRKTWTWSGWVKRSSLSSSQYFFGAVPSAADFCQFYFNSSDQLAIQFRDTTANALSNTNAVFRDVSAWYHVVFHLDTTQSTATDRMTLWVNGVEQTFSTDARSSITSNGDYKVNDTVQHSISSQQPYGGNYFNGYLADVHFIDGQALAATDFGEFDATTGAWNPIAYSGSYGTNGFHLDFSDNSSASALGTDSSGNGNNWTVNNISIGPSYIAGSTLATPINAFDGSTSTYTIVDTTTRVLTNTSISVSSQLEIYSNNFDLQTISLISGGNTYQFEKHPTNNYTVLNNANSQNNTPFTGTLSGPISIVRSAGGASVYAFRVDGTVLVDNSSGIDSLFDSPTNGTQTDTGAGGEVSGNYATLNPLDANSSITLSQGNLLATGTTAGFRSVKSTIGIPNSDKWYFESSTNDLNGLLGVATAAEVNTSYVGATANGWGFQSGGYYNSSFTSGVSFSAGDILNFAVDRDNQKIWFGVNGTWVGSGNPATGANATFSNLPADSPLFGMFTVSASGKTIDVNFGQRAFAYTAPSGFKALCTGNFDTPTIEDPSTVMDVVTYTGDGVNDRTITTSLTTVGAVWIKNRSIIDNHRLATVVQGGNAWLSPNLTGAENTSTTIVRAFSNNTFDVGTDTSVNGSGNGIVAWAWDAGTSTAPNTSGTITSQVRANLSAGFSIVTASPSGSSDTFGHGLGVTPDLIISKRRDSSSAWYVRTSFLANPGSHYLMLNRTDAVGTDTSAWANTAANSSVITVNASYLYGGSCDLIHYCFAAVESYSSFGTYTGNASTDGPFVYTSMRPRFVLLKRTDTTSSWFLFDSERPGYNPIGGELYPNLDNQEATSERIDFCSNGFKLRTTTNAINASSGSFVYMAFAESPFAYARAR